ncbi:hypothetical protein EFR84_08025 [Rhizobium chutanense]|uniref:Uncharacterized protein n=1 Tax=Rhizobium chutanense TaxID=2035448 RepID=A0A3S0S3B4_9HYPH|nr:hypothetical protein EFR84_08025 [Rhizobium chutanense]
MADHVLWSAESMAFPPSPEEADALSEILTLPRVTVTRPSMDHLLAMGMAAYDCHRNCAAYAESYSDGSTRHVWGWIIHGADLILHSVVERGGLWRCLTPQYIEAPSHFPFIPDMTIEWRENADGSREPHRNGTKLPNALRKYPEDHIRMRDRFRELIDSGMSVLDARSMVDATLGDEFSRKPGIRSQFR